MLLPDLRLFFELLPFENQNKKFCEQDIAKTIRARNFQFSVMISVEEEITWLTFQDILSKIGGVMGLWNFSKQNLYYTVI